MGPATAGWVQLGIAGNTMQLNGCAEPPFQCTTSTRFHAAGSTGCTTRFRIPAAALVSCCRLQTSCTQAPEPIASAHLPTRVPLRALAAAASAASALLAAASFLLALPPAQVGLGILKLLKSEGLGQNPVDVELPLPLLLLPLPARDTSGRNPLVVAEASLLL